MDTNALFPAAKLEEVTFDSPTTAALLEALLSDETAGCDFMICSPVGRVSLPMRSNSSHDYGDTLVMKGKSITRCTPNRFSPQVGSYPSSQKFYLEPSPLYKVFYSPGYQELLADYNLKYDEDGDGDGLGLYSSAHCFDVSATSTATLEMPNASRLHKALFEEWGCAFELDYL